ncbi:MAG: protein phosphatase 2C domain-containing protein [Candidatus Competibacter sp.]|nr:protein phosphatase 2C domain-containing protein [Candidatus Competibacter sp.]
MSPVPILPGNAQHRGDREEQQDSFGFSDLNDRALLDRGGALAVLADGMGGHALGRAASQTAVKVLLDGYPQSTAEESIPITLRRLLHEANAAVRALAEREGELDNAGTTLAAVVVHQQALHWIAVGDSRIYLYHASRVTLLTADHVYARELDREVAAGRIAATEADEHPQREALTSFLGMPDLRQVECNLQPVPLHPGDRVLLCSDGLYRNLGEAELAEELARPDPQAAAEALLGRALARPQPRQDNLTIVILALGGTTDAAIPANAPRRGRWPAGLLVGALLAGTGAGAGWWLGRARQEPPPVPNATTAPPPVTPVVPPSTAPVTPSPPAAPVAPALPAPATPSKPPAPATPPATPSPSPVPSHPGLRT